MFYAHDACCEQEQNDRKSFLGPVQLRFPRRSCAKLGLGLVRLHFGGVWDALGRLLDVTWPAWGTLGRLLVPLGRLLGPSWPLPGRSWVSLGQPEALFGCILTPRAAPGFDFGGFGDVPGFVLKGFGHMFSHTFACSTHFAT